MSQTIEALIPLAIATPAPAFNLMASGNRMVSLADYAGKNLILVFYPKDQTPGCTQQLCALQDDLAMFEDLNTAVLASNPASMESHDRFAAAQGYRFPILVDAEKTMAADYCALKPEGGIQRTVYIIDAKGIIQYAKQGMPTDEELADVIRGLA